MTPDRVRTVAEQLRDELTNMTDKRPSLIYPMALDVIATTPWLCSLLSERLSK